MTIKLHFKRSQWWKGGAGPGSLLHTTPEGPTEYVNARWTVKTTWIPTWHRMDPVKWSLGLFSKDRLLEVQSNLDNITPSVSP